MRALLAFGAFCLLLTASDVGASSSTTLSVVNSDGDRTILGVMMSEDICLSVASHLNFYAELPPADPVRFYCRSPY